MSEDQSNSDLPSDRTIIMPSPGRRAAAARPENVADARPSPVLGADEAQSVLRQASSAYSNPLVLAAAPLLTAAARMRDTPRHDDPTGLRNALVASVRDFDAQAQAAGIAPEKIVAARYVLCTMVDEAAADTPWGGGGVWGRQSLLLTFFNETSGGEKSFQVLAKLAEDPPRNRDVLELMHVCLALGFQGRYRVVQNGAAQLTSVRERLWNLLRQTGAGAHDAELSPQWQPPAVVRSRSDGLPVWVVGALTVAGLGLFYGILVFWLNASSDPAFAAIQTIRAKQAPVLATPEKPAPVQQVVERAPPPPQARPKLAPLLQQEIASGAVAVQDYPERSIVTLPGEGLFASGSTTVTAERRPAIQRVAEAIVEYGGPALVVGHTDNEPIRSLRFPSNWALSQERAESVLELLAQRVPREFLRAEGRADTEPIAPNDTREGRARNRRVEIIVLPPSLAPRPAEGEAAAAAAAGAPAGTGR